MGRTSSKIAGVFMLVTLSAPAFAGELMRREVRQQARVEQGAASGNLNAKETARLESREAKADAKIERDRQDGGGLTPAERARDNARLNRTSRAVYRQKHDAQHR